MASPSPSLYLHPTLSFFLFLLLLILHVTPSQTAHPDLAPLLAFKSSSDISNKLSTWTTTNPCHTFPAFLGVSCLHNRVTSLVLENLNLQGRFDSLTSLAKLRVLSLKHNQLTGPIPDLSNLTSLKLVFLSHNHFYGNFPLLLPSLFRLDLSYNNISGRIPVTINRMTNLLTLRLEENKFSGSIDFLSLPSLKDINISKNNLSGEIPISISGFPQVVFSDNPFLCGSPLLECTKPKIASSPTTLPSIAAVPKTKGNRSKRGKKRVTTLAIVAIIFGDVFVLVLVSFILYCYFAKDSDSEDKNVVEMEKPGLRNSIDKGKMVFLDGGRRFELEELLKASAEMLGKGGLGTTYKAMLDDGNMVVVKRLKDVVITGGKREFEDRMEVLGRLRHPNIVRLKAYYFAKDEKLLVYDYMSNGNLFGLLHGNRGPGRTPLDWPTRLKIAAGASRGLAYIHNFSTKLTHGNLKSTNILLDQSGNVYLSDVGLSPFTPPSAIQRSTGYNAPELSPSNNTRNKTTQKSDVYSFGVLLMELLTGKCPASMMMDNGGIVDLPRWVQSVVREEWTAEVFDLELMSYKDIEEEMVGLLHIAISCTSSAPEQRPVMSHVAKMIHEIEGSVDQMSPASREMLNSVSNSPPVI
uniref:probable leucine-rich repeat receptor-like protein kinase At1g68400 n=1 Tax=Erigeron canadensis TaxID=72917 RepID=UPI001CB90F4E|nr:probable leucine-rich repeat receptor-like protein kinase At1g68400 [Erigeron canadensis]